MSHGKPPRKPRWPAAVNTMDLVSRRVALVTPADLAQVMAPLQAAFTALRAIFASRASAPKVPA